MDFLQFAQAHGLYINNFKDSGKWERCSTSDKPRHQNGSYLFKIHNGQPIGILRNWATMTESAVWFADKENGIKQYQSLKQELKNNDDQIANETASKAAWMISKSTPSEHDYFHLKGHPEHQVLTMDRNGTKLALLPMRIDNKISSLQIIGWDKDDRQWRKTFLKGGKVSGAVFTIGKGYPILCEGYATGLSIAHSIRKANVPCRVIVCYSAQNMKKISKTIEQGLVVADNDKSLTGENIAKEIGFPYWVSKTQGFDFNDEHLETSDFKMMLAIKDLYNRRVHV